MCTELKQAFLAAAAFAMALVCSSQAGAAPRTSLADGAIGRIELETQTPASQRPLITRSYIDGPKTVISGILTVPPASGLARDGRIPAVILAHGTGGVSKEREHAWAERLNSWGIAVFVLDSFTGRGIKPPMRAEKPGATHFAAHVVDAYRALVLLATHPKLDGDRIAIMGFSRGGELALNAIFDRFRTGAIGDAPHRFAAYIPLYPYCNFRHVGKSLAAAPMLMLLGGADEMTEPEPCQRAAEWLKGRGVPVRVVTYPGAFHGFDRLQPVVRDPGYVGIRKCEAEYDVDTLTMRRLDTGAALPSKEAVDTWVLECRKTGGRLGGNRAARDASIKEVQAFLTDVLRR